MLRSVVVRRTGSGPHNPTLIAESTRALADAETARFTEIVLPGVAGRTDGKFVELVALARAEGLRMGESRRLLQRKANLRVGGIVDAAVQLARCAVGHDVTGRPVSDIRRHGEGT